MSTFNLKGLNTYRAVAALVVLVSHVELFKKNGGHAHYFDTAFFKHTGGHIAVVLFFALSGFLITLLLLREKDKYATVSLKKFYMRRILRVWPLYYLVIFVSLFLFGYSPSAKTLLLCLTIFPNVAHGLNIPWVVSPQIWSIGVEEQFYLVWPFIVKKVKSLLAFLVSVFLFFTFIPHVALFVMNRVYPDPEYMTIANSLFAVLKFNCMAAGGILAVLYHRKHKIVRLLNHNVYVSYAFILLPFVLWLAGFHVRFFTDEVYAVLFAISILNISTNPSVVNIDIKPTQFLGRISYGIYMYHWIILEILFRQKWIPPGDGAVFNIGLYSSAVLCTVAVSALSFNYIEKPFLNIKDRLYGR